MTENSTTTPRDGDQDLSASCATQPTAGAGTIAVLSLAWLLAMLSSARQAIGTSPDDSPLAVTRAALELPQVISASLIAGIAVGLVLSNVITRVRPAAGSAFRLAAGTAAGVATGLLVATPILLEYDGMPSILVLSGAVATAAALGGLLTGLRHRTVIAAGACGAIGVFAVGLVERAFEPDLRDLFGAGDSPQSVVVAAGWAVLTASLVAGLVAGLLGYLYLRRSGPAELRWPAYLVAGAMPGLLVLLAELVTRLGGARLFQLVSAVSSDDQQVLDYFHGARLNRAMVVLFVGALVAIFLLGRTLRPAGAPVERPADDPAEPPAVAGRDEPAGKRVAGKSGEVGTSKPAGKSSAAGKNGGAGKSKTGGTSKAARTSKAAGTNGAAGSDAEEAPARDEPVEPGPRAAADSQSPRAAANGQAVPDRSTAAAAPAGPEDPVAPDQTARPRGKDLEESEQPVQATS